MQFIRSGQAPIAYTVARPASPKSPHGCHITRHPLAVVISLHRCGNPPNLPTNNFTTVNLLSHAETVIVKGDQIAGPPLRDIEVCLAA